MQNYWHAVEQQWRDTHIDSLTPHLRLVRQTHDWTARIAQHSDIAITAGSSIINVSRLLLRRLGEELRGVELLAEHGHGFQSATAACNLFEQSHYLTYVGISQANADQFNQWTDVQRSPVNVKDLINHVAAVRSWPQDRCDEEYSNYRLLCGFKHNNPKFQQLLKLQPDPDLVVSQFALAESISCVLSAVGLFAMFHLQPQNVNSFMLECAEMTSEVSSLFPTIALPSTETK